MQKEVLNDDTKLKEHLLSLSKLASQLDDKNDGIYSNEILDLYNNYDKIKDPFMTSVRNGGLYFEVPSFTNVNVKGLKKFVESEFNLTISDPIRIPRETFKYIKQKAKINLPLPKEDMIYPKIFNAPIYLLKLMQLASTKITARDFGSYSVSSKQPIKDRVGISTGSRLGGINKLCAFKILLIAGNSLVDNQQPRLII